MTLVLTEPAALEPVSLAEAKAHMVVQHEDDDQMIASLITSAREWAEAYLTRALVTQTWTLYLDTFLPYIELCRPPVQEVNSLKYVDTAGVLQTLDPSSYAVDTASEPAVITPAYGVYYPVSRCQRNALQIEFVAGYGDAATSVPAGIKRAIMQLVGHWYSNREGVLTGTISKEYELSAKSLLNAYRWSVYA